MVYFFPRVISGEKIAFLSPCEFLFDLKNFFYNISHNHLTIGKIPRQKPVIIKVMKKFILSALLPLLFLLSTFSPVPVQSASAESSLVADSYACILTDEAFFYSSRDEKRGLFLLPKTYYVKIIEADPEFCRIEYLYDDAYVQKLVGYAKTSDLTPVPYVPKRPYLYRLIEVSYTIGGGGVPNSGFLDQITVTCAYYGDYRIGSETYSYILRDGSFGYIPKPVDLTYDTNTEYAEWQEANAKQEEGEEEEEGEQATPAQIAILIALCLLVPVLAALILRPNKRSPYDTEE